MGGGRGQPRGRVCAACPSSSTRRPAAHPLLAASGPPSAPPPAAPAGEPSPEGLPGGLPAHGVLCPLVSGESGPRAVRPWAGQSSDLACDHGQGSPAAQAAGRGRPWRPGEGPRPPRPRPRARPVPAWARTRSSTGGEPGPPRATPPWSDAPGAERRPACLPRMLVSRFRLTVLFRHQTFGALVWKTVAQALGPAPLAACAPLCPGAWSSGWTGPGKPCGGPRRPAGQAGPRPPSVTGRGTRVLAPCADALLAPSATGERVLPRPTAAHAGPVPPAARAGHSALGGSGGGPACGSARAPAVPVPRGSPIRSSRSGRGAGIRVFAGPGRRGQGTGQGRSSRGIPVGQRAPGPTGCTFRPPPAAPGPEFRSWGTSGARPAPREVFREVAGRGRRRALFSPESSSSENYVNCHVGAMRVNPTQSRRLGAPR